MRNDAVRAAEEGGHDMQVDDAKDDVGLQLSHVQNYIASGVDAILVNAVGSFFRPSIKFFNWSTPLKSLHWTP